MSKFDTEYYVMSPDGANNHPLLNWGSTSNAPFRKKLSIEEGQLELPLKIIFDDPYPQDYEMADFLTLGAQYAISGKLKKLFERENVYGVQFFPIEVTTDKGNIELGHFAMHFWNRIAAIDKNTFEGKIDPIGLATNFNKFSLDKKTLENIPLEKRLVIRLAEAPYMILIHQSIYEAIQTEQLKGMAFFRVDQWDSGSIFRM